MIFPELVEVAREAIQNRIENGYPFEEFETVETVALDMVEQADPFEGAPIGRVKRAVKLALKFEKISLPETL